MLKIKLKGRSLRKNPKNSLKERDEQDTSVLFKFSGLF